jgi:hypothetical protein
VHNRQVQFQINDVYFPDPEKILVELHGKDLLRGKVIDVTEDGKREGTFLVIQVEELAQPLVVPLCCVHELM